MIRINLNTHCNATKMQQTWIRGYSRPLLGATIAPNLVNRFLKKKFSKKDLKIGLFEGGNKTILISPCFPKAWTEITAQTIVESSSLRPKKLLHRK